MTYKLVDMAQARWRRLDAAYLLATRPSRMSSSRTASSRKACPAGRSPEVENDPPDSSLEFSPAARRAGGL